MGTTSEESRGIERHTRRVLPEHAVRRVVRRTGVRRIYKRYQHSGLKPADVFVGAYPKSGSTWVRFVLADLILGHDCGFGEVEMLIPQVGSHRNAPRVLREGGRLIKTHEPYRQVYRRAILVLRDPRDVVLSYRRFLTGFGHEYPDLSAFVRDFSDGLVGGYGSWLEHTSGWLAARESGAAIHIVRYEDLKQSAVSEFESLVDSLDLDFPESRVAEAVARNSAERMRAKEPREREFFNERGWTNEISFVGKAEAGGWREQLTEEDLEALRPSSELYESIEGNRPAAAAAGI